MNNGSLKPADDPRSKQIRNKLLNNRRTALTRYPVWVKSRVRSELGNESDYLSRFVKWQEKDDDAFCYRL